MKKTVLILGASSDIGIALTEKFLKKNYYVNAHCNKNSKDLKNLKKKFKNLKVYKFDLSNVESLDKQVKKNDFFKKIDIFISLSGYLSFATIKNFKIKEFNRHLNVNYLSSIIVLRQIINHMVKKNWGRILLSSSIGTKFGGANNTYIYSVTKYLNEFFPKYLKEITKFNILSNTLQIGVTNTKLLHKDKNKNLKKRVKLIPLNRMANVNEVTKKIYFLTSSENTLITGQVLNISGGE